MRQPQTGRLQVLSPKTGFGQTSTLVFRVPRELTLVFHPIDENAAGNLHKSVVLPTFTSFFVRCSKPFFDTSRRFLGGSEDLKYLESQMSEKIGSNIC